MWFFSWFSKTQPDSVDAITASLSTMKDQLVALRSEKLEAVESIQVEIQEKLHDQELARQEAEKAARVFGKLAAILE